MSKPTTHLLYFPNNTKTVPQHIAPERDGGVEALPASVKSHTPLYPKEYDPRNDHTVSGVLTKTQNQGQCGSCWAQCVGDSTTLVARIRAVRVGKDIPHISDADPLALLSCMPLNCEGCEGNCECCGGYPILGIYYTSIDPLGGYPNGRGIPPLSELSEQSANTVQRMYDKPGGIFTSKCMSYEEWCSANNCLTQSATDTSKTPCDCNSSCVSSSKAYPLVSDPSKTGKAVCGGGNPNWYYKYINQNGRLLQYTSGQYSLEQFRNIICDHILNFGCVIAAVNSSKNLQTYGAPEGNTFADGAVGQWTNIKSMKPFSVTDQNTFSQTYDGGHAMLIVGWKKFNNGDFAWLFKNSWGDSYGDNGYFYILSSEDNLCGIEANNLPSSANGQNTVTPQIVMFQPSQIYLQTYDGSQALKVADFTGSEPIVDDPLSGIDGEQSDSRVRDYLIFFAIVLVVIMLYMFL